MSQNEYPLIDINTANEETLTQLTGVGPQLAKRIAEARPFLSIDDLTRVRGIGDRDIERLRPQITVSAVDAADEPMDAKDAVDEETDDIAPTDATADIVTEEQTDSEEAEAIPEPFPSDEAREDDEAETNKLAESATEDAPEETSEPESEPSPAPEKQPRYISSSKAWGMVFLGSVMATVLAIIITLGIIASFNHGRLTHASPAQVTALQNTLIGLSDQSARIETDLDGLRTRIDNLEALSGQINDIEDEVVTINTEISTLQTDLANTQAQYDEISAEIQTLNEQLEILQAQNNQFDDFLQGLRNLLNGLYSEPQE